MQSYIVCIDANHSVFHCIRCNITVSSIEHDCDAQTFVYTKEEIDALRKEID